MNTKPSFSYGIKGKLISAVSMLLVAVIMVVSSTYAWFTLSTAPEVTGISTAIGANGALEIRLAGEKYDTVYPTNTTWGNIVDLGYEGYGLQDIVLLPAMLNDLTNTGTINRTNPLLFPQYGADGRPSSALTSALIAKYNSSKGEFYAIEGEDNAGVLAVGTASGMTDRQLAYRNARSAASTASSAARTAVSVALAKEGGTLAQIVVNHMMNADATISIAEQQSLERIVAALESALAQIKSAYEQQIVAIAASAKANEFAAGANMSDTIAENFYLNVQNKINDGNNNVEGGITLDGIATAGAIKLTVDTTEYSYTLSADMKDALEHYVELKTDITAARTAINALKTGEGSTFVDNAAWGGVSTVVHCLIDYSAEGRVDVNGVDLATESTDKKQDLVQAISNAGFKVTMNLGPNSGVFESIADQCGDFTALVSIPELAYGGMTVRNFETTIQTHSDVVAEKNKSYLTAASDAVNVLGAPASTGGTDQPLTEFYGYILDMFFQTNAAGSTLLLQTEPADRIYDDNSNSETLGGGSTMTFKATLDGFTEAQIKKLMDCIRIVFFDASNKVLVQARLDTAHATYTEATGVTAKMYIYVETYQLTYTPADGTETKIQVYQGSGDNADKFYTDNSTQDDTTLVNTAVGGAHAGGTIEAVGSFIGDNEGEKASIVSLAQNTQTAVSVLVYLDGKELQNKDVNYNGDTSVTGKMNIQFASDANLTPMEYGGLHITDGTSTPATEYTVTYDITGATAGTAPAAVKVTSGEDLTTLSDGAGLAGPTDTPVFKGWSTAPDGSAPVTRLTDVDKNITLYAIWGTN